MLPGPLSAGAFLRAWVVAVVVAHRVDGSNNQWQRQWWVSDERKVGVERMDTFLAES